MRLETEMKISLNMFCSNIDNGLYNHHNIFITERCRVVLYHTAYMSFLPSSKIKSVGSCTGIYLYGLLYGIDNMNIYNDYQFYSYISIWYS